MTAAATAAAWMATYLLHSTLLLGAAWALSRLLGGRRLGIQEVVWKTALVGGLLTATLQVGVGVRPLGGSWELATAAAAPAAMAPAPPVAALPVPAVPAARPPAGAAAARPGTAWPLAALLVWAVVAAALAGRLAARYALLAARLRHRWPVADGTVAALFGRLLGRSGRRRAVGLSGSERLPVPIAWGLVRPEVSLPGRVVRELSPYHQESILAHELAHVMRRDPAWRGLGRLLECLLFFQPLNRLARRRLEELAEYRCDDHAVELTGRPVELARCLTEVAAWQLPAATALPVPSIGSGSLTRRVQRLLAGEARPDRLPAGLGLAGGAALVALALLVPGVRAAVAPRGPEPAATDAEVVAADAMDEPSGTVDDPNHGWVIDDEGEAADVAPIARAAREEARAARERALAEHRARHREAGAEAHREAQRMAHALAAEAREHARDAHRHARDLERRHAERAHGDCAAAGALGREVRREVERALVEAERIRAEALAGMDLDAATTAAQIATELAEVHRATAAIQAEVARELAGVDVDVRAAGEAAREAARAMAAVSAEQWAAQEVATAIAAELAAAGLSERERAEIDEEVRRAIEQSALEIERSRAEIERALGELDRIGPVPEAELWRLEREMARARRELEREREREARDEGDTDVEAPPAP